MKSRHLSSGDPINLACLLLILSVYFISTLAQSELYTSNNWIEQSDKKWPKTESKIVSPFLVFHSEYKNGKLFGLNSSLRTESWLNDPDLYFRYWVSEQTYFRSRKDARSPPERDLKLLFDSNGWSSIDESEKNLKKSLKSISKTQWDKFEFESSDIFTMGLKDVSVKVVEKIDTSVENQFTGYPADVNGFKIVNFINPKTKGGSASPGSDVVFDDSASTITFNGNTEEKFNLKQLKFQVISFNYIKDGANKDLVKITVENKVKCIVDKHTEIFKYSKCSNGIIETLQVEKTDKFVMSEFKGLVDAKKLTEVTPKSPTELKTLLLATTVNPPSGTGVTYNINETTLTDATKYTQVKGYIQLNEVRPTGVDAFKDTCYKIKKHDEDVETGASSVDVYLTLPGEKVGIKLDTISKNDDAAKKPICLFDYLALKNINKYMITLVVQGQVTKKFNVNVATSHEGSAVKPLGVPDSQDVLASPQWFYYNSIFEIVLNTDDPSAVLFACDVLSSCYPLKSTENTPSNYVMPEIFKNILNNSPFFQIRGISAKPVKFVKSTTAQSHEKFNNVFIKENANFLIDDSVTAAKKDLTKAAEFQLKFDDQKTSTISFSLDSIDMRFQKLKMNIDLVNAVDGKPADESKNKLMLNSFTLKKENNNEWEFPLTALKAKISLNKFSTATDEIFSLRSTQYSTGNKITLQLKLEADSSAKLVTKVKFTVLPLGNRQIEPKITKDKLILKGKQGSENIANFAVESHKTRFFLTDFIENAETTKLGKTGLNLELSVKSSAKTQVENYRVYRVIVDQGNPVLKIVGPGVFADSTNNIVKFSDAVTSGETTDPLNGRFRVLYAIYSNSTNKDTVTIDKFTVDGQEITDATNNEKASQVLANVNLKYELASAACAYKAKFEKNVCSLPSFINQFTEIKCDMAIGCNNIFDLQLPVSAQAPTDPTQTLRFVPFKLAKGKREENQLVIKRKSTQATIKPDFCVEFFYLAKTTSLYVTDDSDNQNVIEFPLTLDSKVSPNPKSKVCASHFTENVDSVNSLIFYFASHELDIDNHYVEIAKTDLDSQAGLTDIVLKTGIYISNLENNQFLERTNWETVIDKTTFFKNSISFKILKNTLETLPANGKYGSSEFYYETLRSKWIEMPVEGASLKYGLTYNNNLSKDNNSIVVDQNTVVRIVSSRTAPKSKQLKSFTTDALFTLEKALPPITTSGSKVLTSEHYRLEIDVVLNVSKKAELIKAKTWKSDDLLLVIENLSVNDPCIVGNALSTLQKCNPIKDTGLMDPDHNWCRRGYNASIFGPDCQCNKNYTGTTCEQENYCKTQGFTLCGSENNCENDEKFKQIKCKCFRTGEIWNPFLKGCIVPDDLTKCGQFSRPLYTKNGVTCQCLDDYVEVHLNATTKACVPFEPCKKEHRELKGLIGSACPAANTSCVTTGSKTQPDDFKCNCNTGFINVNEVYTSKATCLPEICGTCPGRCKLTNKVYSCDQKACDINGYDYEPTNNTCTFNGVKFGRQLGCAAKAIIDKKDKKPACECAKGQKLDLVSRQCSKSECDDEAVAACKVRGAEKCTFDGTNAVCSCKDSELPYATEQVNASDWKCVSKCSLLDKPDNYEARCSNPFEHCNNNAHIKLALLNGNSGTATKDAKNSPRINGVFVKNYTKIDVSGTGQKSHCACDLGFNLDSKTSQCFPSTIPTHTISNFEFDLIHTHDVAGYIEKVRLAFVNLVATVVGIKEKSSLSNLNSATKCVKSTETTILCQTSFQSKMTNEDIIKGFAAACVPVKNDKTKCFYVPSSSSKFYSNFLTKSAINDDSGIATFSSTSDNDVLIHGSLDNVKVTLENYCSKDKNTCSSFAYSVCKNDKTKPFECLCPGSNPFFKLKSAKKITSPIENGKTIDLQMEICEFNDLCKTDPKKYGCQSKDAQCHSQVELNTQTNTYEGISYCTCPKTGITLSDRSLSCESTCNGWCSKNTASCVQDYLNTKKIVCTCKDGFIGEKCEKSAPTAKKEAEASSSKAYLISTIVVSVIAAIALIGLAVLYFKRR